MAVYDALILGLFLSVFWRCPARRILDLYSDYLSSNHLDIGVGTGYFLERSEFPSNQPRLTIIDLNPNSLEEARRRLSRYRPEAIQADALRLPPPSERKYDSIGVANLIHCLPGDMSTKSAAFSGVKGLLNPGGVVFGSTLLGIGADNSRLARLVMRASNAQGGLTCLDDDADGLRSNLDSHFDAYGVEIVGSMALFWARTSV